jgi:hypothetical protein
MIKSPKEKFQSSQIRTGQWEQIVSNHIFDEACDVALLQMQHNLPPIKEEAFESHMKMVGAQDFLRTLKTLHETTQEPKKETRQGLNYQAGV